MCGRGGVGSSPAVTSQAREGLGHEVEIWGSGRWDRRRSSSKSLKS